jgi:hypothetical protein
MTGAKIQNFRDLKSKNILDLSRAEAFVSQLQRDLAEAQRCQAVAAAIIGELGASTSGKSWETGSGSEPIWNLWKIFHKFAARRPATLPPGARWRLRCAPNR